MAVGLLERVMAFEQMILFAVALVAAVGWALWTGKRLMAAGFVAMLLGSLPAILHTLTRGDFWMGESLVMIAGLMLGTGLISASMLRA